jgi:hypothetical protein
MPNEILRKQNTIEGLERDLAQLPNDKKLSIVQTAQWYVDNLIKLHFTSGNGARQGYKPNTSKYNDWKRKHYGELPQLYLSGRLYKAVLAGKVNKATGEVIFDLPQWGLYQVKAGRDFLTPSKKEQDILDKMQHALFIKIRRKSLKI